MHKLRNAYVLRGKQRLQVESYVDEITCALLRATFDGQFIGLLELLSAQQALEKVEHCLLLVLERQFAGVLAAVRIAATVHQTFGRT